MSTDVLAEINRIWELEQKDPDKAPVLFTDIPQRYENMTPEWLTTVLCAGHPGAQITGFSLGPVDNGSSNRRRVTLEYNEAGRAAGLPPSIFCKASQGLLNRIVLGLGSASYLEVAFYNEVRPSLDIEAPRSFHAAVDRRSCNSIVMLEDLTGLVTLLDHKTDVTRELVESQLAQLARLHGKYYGSADTDPVGVTFDSWPDYFHKALAFGIEDGSNQGFLEAEEVIPARLFRRYEDIWPTTMRAVAVQDDSPRTFAHGDVHLKNWYLAADGQMGLADWQNIHRGHWARDVSYAISTALSVENRRAWERELLEFYLDRLHAHGAPKLSFDEAWLAYRQQLMSALTWWTVTLHPSDQMPDMQPVDLTLEFIRRLATTIDDVESLDALR